MKKKKKKKRGKKKGRILNRILKDISEKELIQHVGLIAAAKNKKDADIWENWNIILVLSFFPALN